MFKPGDKIRRKPDSGYYGIVEPGKIYTFISMKEDDSRHIIIKECKNGKGYSIDSFELVIYKKEHLPAWF